MASTHPITLQLETLAAGHTMRPRTPRMIMGQDLSDHMGSTGSLNRIRVPTIPSMI
jgi:hypothetical protein